MKKELLKAVILELAKLFTPIAWIAHFCHMNEVQYTGSLDFIFYGIGLNLKDRIKVERWLLAKLDNYYWINFVLNKKNMPYY